MMTSIQRDRGWRGKANFQTSCITIAAVMVAMAFTLPAEAQTYNVIHSLSGGGDGSIPFAGLTMDRAGNLYGTTSSGGQIGGNCSIFGCGVVFKMKRSGSSWVLTPLYTFLGGSDGANPLARVTIGPDGSLYGTTNSGGTGCDLSGGCGTVFRLRPPATACGNPLCRWTETVLHRFTGPDGASPLYGDLIFDQAGNIYGTTEDGGASGNGVVFKLSPSGGGYTETVLHSFASSSNGAVPAGGVIFDNAGNLYGTTQFGGTVNHGTVYELSPSGSGWTETVLSSLENVGTQSLGGLIFDSAGNLYGTTSGGGPQNGGTVFELQPSNGSWTDIEIQHFSGDGGPTGTLTMDAAGNLYGTAERVNSNGVVFKLSPEGSGWAYSELHDFGGGNDGLFPFGNVVLDASGNLFGTTSAGGTSDSGVVWESSP